MSQQLRFIVDKLNEPPFSNKFNMVTFDALDPFNLLQVLNDVLAEISPEHQIDLRREQPEQAAVRIFSFLRVLKYSPKSDQGGGLNTFRQGLLEGDKSITYKLLYWLLEKITDLKKRAHLSKYLAKIYIPAEFQQNEQIVEATNTLEALMEQFKELHKTIEQQHNSKFSIADVRNDISSMEEENDQLMKRIEWLKKKVVAVPNSENMLEAAKKLRVEKDREIELTHQMMEQKTLLVHAKQKLEVTLQELKEAVNVSASLTPQKILEELEEENRLKCILTKQNITQKIDNLQQESVLLADVLESPLPSDMELRHIWDKIAALNEEIATLREKKLPGGDPAQDKLALFRQQASIITRKRNKAAEEFKALMDQLAVTQKEVEINRELLKDFDGGVALQDEKFKRYVGELRTITVDYRAKKLKLSALKAECGVLDRTVEILKSRDENVLELMKLLEMKKGVHGYRSTQDAIENASAAKSKLDEITGQKLTDMTVILRELNNKIEKRKALLAPLIKEVRPLRLKHLELQAKHTEKKVLYDGVTVGLQTQRSGLDQEVCNLWNETMSEERQYHYLQCILKSLHLQEERVATELHSYIAPASANKMKKSLREEYKVKIQEAEILGRALRDEQKELKETHVDSLEQVKMWEELKLIMEVKKECFILRQEEMSQAKAVEQRMIAGENRLVIS